MGAPITEQAAEQAQMEAEAFGLVRAGQPLNRDGAGMLLSWMQRTSEKHPDFKFAKAAVDQFYQSQPGADAPVHLRDTFVMAPAGGSGSTRGMRGER
jgi:hypothetical protein